jgi:hypothetical protein
MEGKKKPAASTSKVEEIDARQPKSRRSKG